MLGRCAPVATEAYIRLVHKTTRWQWDGRETLQKIIDDRTPVIYAFWHNRISMMCPLMQESQIPIRAMVSKSGNGDVISKVVQRFGHDTIRGSTRNPNKTHDKGGKAALLTMIAHLRAGGAAAMTPDGPRGPKMQAQLGASYLSAQTGLPIVPLAYSSSCGRFLKTWDDFLLPLPFGRGAYVVGDKISPPTLGDEANIERHRQMIEHTLTALTGRADMMVGQSSVQAGK